MNVKQLEAFCKVMETGSMSEAGRLLGVSQPAISKSIRILEQSLQLRLFKRLGDKIYPSAEAQRLYPNARRIFDELQSTVELSLKLRAAETGKLRIAATYAVTAAYISEAFGLFHRARPLIKLQFMALPPRQIIEIVADVEADLGILYEPITTPRVSQIPLCEIDLVCLLPKHHYLSQKTELSANDLAGETIISFSDAAYAGSRLKSQVTLAGCEWKPAIIVNQAAVAKSMVTAGIGIAVIDPLTLDAHSAETIDIRPFRPRTTLLVSAIIPMTRPFSPLCREFVDILRGVARQHAAQASVPSGTILRPF
jgi:DNA-binding transcriptional LysR family regulator